ncbi:hypothetical protein GGX14DRAFT_537686 [Mycena pura]|uniref:Uncharacterized protein n=1 Tax=Mycena pura TaxID=153505 RepID=A0AAD6UQX7_9AGAR|nr:hypothetical protein GGX14DRAFT_537686 [Mycena pura]
MAGPTYEELLKWEDDLPQHNLDLPFPEGQTGRFVKFSNQANFLGWNNCLNERLMNAHLAYMAKRAYVFSDYWWAPEHYRWPYPKGGARTPMSAMISGPIVGGAWESGDDAPRSVSDRWFNVVCPPSERRIIAATDVKPAVGGAPGDVVFAHWQQLLFDAPERCIEVVPGSMELDTFPQVFDLGLWGTPRVLALWDLFAPSPTSRLLGPSPIVESALARNSALFVPRGARAAVGPAARDPYARMLAVHLRRGDYEVHCHNLAAWGAQYYGWAQLPLLPDKLVLPDGDVREEAMLAHCLPTAAQLAQRVDEVRRDYVHAGAGAGEGRALDVLYVLTNEAGPWLDELKRVLRDAGAGWDTIVTTRDLRLDQEQTDVGMAVDMELARRAAVFIGNGWSSYTSAIIHQRLVDGREPISIRLT